MDTSPRIMHEGGPKVGEVVAHEELPVKVGYRRQSDSSPALSASA